MAPLPIPQTRGGPLTQGLLRSCEQNRWTGERPALHPPPSSPTREEHRVTFTRSRSGASGERRAVPQNGDEVLVENVRGSRTPGRQHSAPGSAHQGLL